MDTSALNSEFLLDLSSIDLTAEEDSFASPHADLPANTSSDQFTPRATSSNINRWDPRLVIDIALGVDALPEILERFGLSLDEYQHLYDSMAFRRELALTIRELKESGLTFSSKCKALAEGYLEDLDDIVKDDNVAAGVRLSAIQSVVHWGRLEPPKDKASEGAAPPAVNIQINF